MATRTIPSDVLEQACDAVRPLECEVIPQRDEGFLLRVRGGPLEGVLSFSIARIATLNPTRYRWLLLDVREVLKAHGCVLDDWPDDGAGAGHVREEATFARSQEG